MKNVNFTISVYIQILKLPSSKFRNALVNRIIFNKLDISHYYLLANEVAKGYSNATVRPSVTSL
jgi:hypothetical protein